MIRVHTQSTCKSTYYHTLEKFINVNQNQMSSHTLRSLRVITGLRWMWDIIWISRLHKIWVRHSLEIKAQIQSLNSPLKQQFVKVLENIYNFLGLLSLKSLEFGCPFFHSILFLFYFFIHHFQCIFFLLCSLFSSTPPQT